MIPVAAHADLLRLTVLVVSHANVGLLVVVSHPLKLTALAFVAVAAFHVIFIPQVPLAHPHIRVGA